MFWVNLHICHTYMVNSEYSSILFFRDNAYFYHAFQYLHRLLILLMLCNDSRRLEKNWLVILRVHYSVSPEWSTSDPRLSHTGRKAVLSSSQFVYPSGQVSLLLMGVINWIVKFHLRTWIISSILLKYV